MLKKLLFKKLNHNFSRLSATINLKPLELELSGKKCLCLSPHQDDETLGMGGTLKLFSDCFDVILLTDGQKGIKDKSKDETIKIRNDEFAKAMAIAGVKHFELKAEDKKLLNFYDTFKQLDFHSYDYIFIPNIIDQHPDHKAVSLLLNKMINEKMAFKPDTKICMYEVWSTLSLINAYIDISDVVETKKAMINCYVSQTSQKDYEYHILGLNQYRGIFKDKKYVETFSVFGLNDFQKICKIYEL